MATVSRVVGPVQQGVLSGRRVNVLQKRSGGVYGPQRVMVAKASSGMAVGNTKVTFSVARHVDFGESVKVVGSITELGNWEAESGLQLSWEEGDIWRCEADIPVGSLEYKYIVGNDEIPCIEWYPGENLEAEVATGEPITLNDSWIPEVVQDISEGAEGTDGVFAPGSAEGDTVGEIPMKDTAENIVTIPVGLESEKAAVPVGKQVTNDSPTSNTRDNVISGENKMLKKNMPSKDDGDKPVKMAT